MKWYLLAPILCAQCILAVDVKFADGLFARGFYEEAAKEYEQAPESAGVNLRLGECYENLNANDRAETNYRRALTNGSSDEQCYAAIRLSKLLMAQKRVDEAAEILESKVFLTNKSSNFLRHGAMMRLAICREMQDRVDDAMSLYRYLVNNGDEQQSNAARVRLGAILLRRKEYKSAAALFEKVQDPSINTMAAWANYYAGNLTHAWDYLSAIPDEQRKSEEVLYLIALVQIKLGETRSAENRLQELLKNYPHGTYTQAAMYDLLTLAVQRNDDLGALELFKTYGQQMDNSYRLAAEQLRLMAAYRQKRVEDLAAATNYLSIHGTDAQSVNAHYRLGMILQMEGEWAAAGKNFEACYVKHPLAEIAPASAYAAAYAYFQAIQKKTPGVTSVQLDTALNFALSSDDKKVISEALMLKARRALADDDEAGAARALDEIIDRFKEQKNSGQAKYLRALIFFKQGDYQSAERILSAVIGSHELAHEDEMDAIVRRAQALYELGAKDAAADLLQTAILTPQAAKLPMSYMKWFVELQLERNALTIAEEGVSAMRSRAATDEERLLADLMSGRVHEKQGHQASAVAAYTVALKRAKETNAPVTYQLEATLGCARLALASKAGEEAAALYEEALKLCSADTPEMRVARAQSFAGLAAACMMTGQQERALRADMNLIIFFDDATLVPNAFREAIAILRKLERADEADALEKEFKTRYPTVKESDNGKKDL